MSVVRRSDAPTPDAEVSSLLPPGFTNEVMKAIGCAPRPSPVRSFGSAIRDRSVSEASGALAVAWRIVRLSTTMPVMVRAQALALVVLVAGSILGGGVLAGVVAYQTVGPIVQAISEPVEDRARTVHEDAPTPQPPAAVEPPTASPSPASHAEPPAGTPDRPPAIRTTTGGPTGPGDDPDDRDEADEADEDPADAPDESDADEPDGGADEEDAEEADPDAASGAETGEPAEAEDPDTADPDEADEPDGAVENGGSDEADEPSDDPDSDEPGDPSASGESDEVERADGGGGGE